MFDEANPVTGPFEPVPQLYILDGRPFKIGVLITVEMFCCRIHDV